MDTISHGAWTYLLMNRHPRQWFIVYGAVFPDLTIIGTAAAMFLRGDFKLSSSWLPQLYSLPMMPLLDSATHSVVLWMFVFGASLFFRWNILQWIVYGVFFHIGIDVATHQTFLPKYLWPISNSTISGLVEYRRLWFTIVNIILLIGYTAWRLYQYRIKV